MPELLLAGISLPFRILFKIGSAAFLSSKYIPFALACALSSDQNFFRMQEKETEVF
jgi:hypothetical protein